jgi:hypothetical protein
MEKTNMVDALGSVRGSGSREENVLRKVSIKRERV